MVDLEHEEWLRAQKEQEEKRFGWRAKLHKNNQKADEDDGVKAGAKAKDDEDEDDDDDDEEEEETE